MCTSIAVNRKKTIIGWNLDLLGMEHRIRSADDGVYIEIFDLKEGWMPLFGANSRGDFVGMPTCWPFDDRSDPKTEDSHNVIMLDIDLLLQKKSLQEIKQMADGGDVCSVPGVTYMSALSDGQGNVLLIIPGQGCRYYEKPDHVVLTNFSPFKGNTETHPWMGWDRYNTAESMLSSSSYDFDVDDCFEILRKVSQEVCPTIVSMVYDVSEKTVYWCKDRNWSAIEKRSFC